MVIGDMMEIKKIVKDLWGVGEGRKKDRLRTRVVLILCGGRIGMVVFLR